jgi:hypothetical protein
MFVLSLMLNINHSEGRKCLDFELLETHLHITFRRIEFLMF